ncbi:MAG TPA: ELWxxDGT repeat protein [Thermoanaerobaculia bacterium]|nr:ELWxxDGT repeat protein [Thermoanaerobaculia bacterium]
MRDSRRLALLSLLLAVLLTGRAQAAGVELVEDIAPGQLGNISEPRNFLSVGNKVVFLAPDDNGFWPGLWATDGTPGGTEMLGSPCPPCGDVKALGSTGEVAFFSASSSYAELGEATYIWRTDGTRQGTRPVAGPFQTPSNRYQITLSALGDHRLYFIACTPALGCELWSSDGTTAGTVPVADLVPGPDGTVFREMVTIGDRAYFLGRGPGGMGLWEADGLSRRVNLLRALPGGLPRPRLLTRYGPRLFFLAPADGMELWTSDGTAGGTVPVSGFRAANPFSWTHFLKPSDGKLYFLADDGEHGEEIWAAEGRAWNPRRVTGFKNPHPFGEVYYPFLPQRLERAGNRLILSAFDEAAGYRLWTSGGTPRTTTLLTGCPGGCPSGSPMYFTRLGNRVVFGGLRPQNGQEPWISDGTVPGTRLLRDVTPGPHSKGVRAFTPVSGGRLLFERFFGQDEQGEIWTTDGTTAGTIPLSKGRYGESHYFTLPDWAPLDLGLLGGKVFYLGTDDSGAGLWVSDGSQAGTGPLHQWSLPESSSPEHLNALALGGRVLFNACRQAQNELWVSAGTAGATSELVDLPFGYCYQNRVASKPVPMAGGAVFQLIQSFETVGTGRNVRIWRTDGASASALTSFDGFYPGQPVPFAGKALFSVSNVTATQTALWTTDGTAVGTQKLLDLPSLRYVVYETSIGSLVYFVGVTASDNSYQIWRTDGTAAGTFAINAFNANPGDGPQVAPEFNLVGDRVYFVTWADGHGPEIWSTDGTIQGTKPAVTEASGADDPNHLETAGGLLYFRSRRTDDDPRQFLWRTDGTPQGTFSLGADLSDGIFTPYFSAPFYAALGDELFFQARDTAHGGELWKTDGTVEGTVLVKDIFPGTPDSHPLWLTAAGDRVVFSASDGIHGTELWSSDGTAEGTQMVDDVSPGASWSYPEWLTVAGDDLFFSASDGPHGRELRRIPLSAIP